MVMLTLVIPSAEAHVVDPCLTESRALLRCMQQHPSSIVIIIIIIILLLTPGHVSIAGIGQCHTDSIVSLALYMRGPYVLMIWHDVRCRLWSQHLLDGPHCERRGKGFQAQTTLRIKRKNLKEK